MSADAGTIGQWRRRHGLGPRGTGSVAQCIGDTGWLHAIGGVDLYVSLWSRLADFDRSQVDSAVAGDRLRVVTGARGCTMLVPTADGPLALGIGDRLWRKRAVREMAKLDVPAEELTEVGDAAVQALTAGPATPQQLRSLLPHGAVRSLGAAGKKLGWSSTLPVALRMAEAAGRIRRMPVGGKLDVERYEWIVDEGRPPLLQGGELDRELARRYLRWASPATAADLAGWSGLGKRAAQAAINAVEADGGVGDPPAVEPRRVVLLSFRDPYFDHRVGLTQLLDPAHGDIQAESWGRGTKPLAEVKALHHRAVLIDGKLAGYWEYDEARAAAEWGAFGPLPGADRQAVEAEVEAVGQFLRDAFGHGRIYPMEAAKWRDLRLELTRELRR